MKKIFFPTAFGSDSLSKGTLRTSARTFALTFPVLMLFFANTVSGQTSVGPYYPGAGTNSNGPGTQLWIDMGYITAADANSASVDLPNTETETYTSENLQGRNYGFSIPAGATINGIQVKIMRQNSNYNPGGYGIRDVSLNLLKAGTISGNNYADVISLWGESMTEITYGGVSDLWGTTWTAEDINNPDFGVSFSVTQNGTGDRVAFVDYISITVTYSAPPPTAVPNFPGSGANVNGPGTQPWMFPGYITADDEDFASVDLPNTETETYTSEYLQGSNYGFSIPTGAIINGIQVKIMRLASDYNPGGWGIYDASLNMLKAGIIVGDNYASSNLWLADLTEATYGGESDLWGTTWSAADINNANFGVSFSVTQNGTGERIGLVDYISVTVYYTLAPVLSVNPASLGFGYVTTGENSSSQTFQLSGSNLTGFPGNITVTAPSTDFQVSNDNISWGATATVAYSSYNLDATDVYVRFTPQTTGAKSGNVTFSGGGIISSPTVALTGTGTAPSGSGDYRSAATGDWNSNSTWESYNGTAWEPATSTPTAGNANSITVRTGHTVTVTSVISVDQVSVESGARVTVTVANFRIADGTGNDFVVDGILELSGDPNSIITDGNLVFNSGSSYIHNRNGGIIPAAAWNVNSTCIVTGSTSTNPGGYDQTFGNFTWDCAQTTDLTLSPAAMSINGNLTVAQTGTAYSFAIESDITVGGDLLITGGQFRVCNSATRILTVLGDVSVTGGTLALNSGSSPSNTGTLNVAGNFSHTAGTISKTGTGTGTIVFNGASGLQTWTSGGTITGAVDFMVNSGAYLQMAVPGTILSGGGKFTLSTGATLGITSPDGITSAGATGNIQVTGTRAYNAGANYIYNGSGAQNTGSGLPASPYNLTFDNTGGAVTLTSVKTITNNFSINQGSVANLGIFPHNTASLTLGGVNQPGGYHGSSSAFYKDFVNDTYFAQSSGFIYVGSGCTAGTWLGITSTDWNNPSNWCGGTVPGSGVDVTISSSAVNQPVISGPTGAVCNSITISSGASFTVSPTGKATTGNLTNNGTLNLQSDALNIGSLILDSYTDNGTENIQLYLTGGEAGGGAFRWHYISLPVVTPFVNLYTDVAPSFNSITLNLARFEEGAYTGLGDDAGWIAYDGYRYSDGATVTGFSALDLGKGFNYYHTADQTYTFSGTLNTGSLSIPLAYSGGSTPGSEIFGFNLLGNPLTCGINWDVISNSGSYPANTSKAVFFTKNNVQYTYTNEVGVPIDATANIPPMQGFFVKTYAAGNSLSIPLSAREHNSTPRYKGEAGNIPLIRLSVTENNKTDETVVRFDELAKTGVDYDFDAVKMSGTSVVPSVSSLSGIINMTINGLPFPDPVIEIPLVLRVGQTANGNHVIKTTQLQGLDDYKVSLVDKTSSITINLKTNPDYTFAASDGLIAGRFVLKVEKISTGVEKTPAADDQFKIYPAFGLINIQPLSDEWEGLKGSVRISGITGKTIMVNSSQVFSTGSIIQVPAPKSQGIYIVELRSGMKRFTAKVVVR